ncbi:MAG: TIGR01777 family protein [Flavobacteriales bacterium]|nr:TIGR01777 family protein [Flavobacteriales bacterium]
MKSNILITGGSGFVGAEVACQLVLNGYQVAILSRQDKPSGIKRFIWDIEKSWVDPDAILFADVIIHLAGENISSKRWTKKQKQVILESRKHTTEILYNAIKISKSRPELIISASAVGYYGTQKSDVIFTETSQQGAGFLAETVAKWEQSVALFQELNIRTVIFRMGVVMSPEGGALIKMLLPLKLGFATPVGNGNQYVPWISLNNLSRLFLFSIETKTINGIFNAVSPIHFTNKSLMQEIAKIKAKPFFNIGVPALLLKFIYGEMSEVILQGNRISSDKIIGYGFEFSDDLNNVFING